MESKRRLSATKYIWFGFFLALAVTNGNVIFFGQEPGIGNVILGVVIAVATCASTLGIWAFQPNIQNEDAGDTKLKRGERVKRLIDLMDDDELYELRERLSTDYSAAQDNYVMLGSDGEIHHRKHKSG